MTSSRVKNALLHGLFEGLVSVARTLPPWGARLMGRAVGRMAHGLLTAERERARAQLGDRYDEVLARPCEPDSRRDRRIDEVVASLFSNLGAWAAELCSMVDRPETIPARVELPARSERVLRRAMERSRGVLFLTGHLGSWEALAWAVAARGFPAAAVGRRSYHEGITGLVHELRTRAGVEVMYRDDADLARSLLSALRRGRIVGLLVDTSTTLPSRPVAFLGRDAPTAEAPARLALRHRGGVVFGWCHEGPSGRLVIEVEPVELDTHTTLDEAMRIINLHVERAVVARPDHWIWMHPRWDER